ncbi:MAG: metalloregulator ArsR/SmtB family transcription factor [Bacteroidia bacterium]|nr:metalloregulator ArsR/SmtB family transcription factor [Bacteroidia bacterium]
MVEASIQEQVLRVKKISRMMKTVGHPTRLQIIELLLEKGPLPVKDIVEETGISQSNASQHLKALEDIEVLISGRQGKSIVYAIGKKQISTLLQCVRSCVGC